MILIDADDRTRTSTTEKGKAMSDLISRQSAIEKINERARETFTLASGYEYYLGALHDVADDLRQMPTIDAVPIVRCQDCKHRPMKRNPNGDDYGFNLYSPTVDEICPCIVGDNWYSWMPKDNFYCAYGERKESV